MFLPDWRQAWRWWSVRVSALGAILCALALFLPDVVAAVWDYLPAEIHARLPRGVAMIVPLVLNLATIWARMVRQRPAGEQRSLWRSISGKASAKAASVISAVAAAIIAATMALEGGYVNHPSDPGGETKDGITKRVAVHHGYTGPMRTLPKEVAQSIYYRAYLVAPGYEPLIAVDAAVTEELFDTTVNMGPGRPSRWFQAAINARCGTQLAIDGRVGPGTIAAYRACQPAVGARDLCVATLDFLDARQRAEYDRLIRVNPKLRVFHRGWIAHRIGNVDRRKCASSVSTPAIAPAPRRAAA